MNDDRDGRAADAGALATTTSRADVPRDEMWARIAASAPQCARAAAGRTAARCATSGSGRASGIAAAAILAVGIAIGRRVERATPAVASAVASDTSRARRRADRRSRDVDGRSPAPDRRFDDREAPRRRQDTDVAPDRSRRNSATHHERSADCNLAYHLVVLQHLAGSEAMITAFRSAARAARWTRRSRAGRESCSAPRACSRRRRHAGSDDEAPARGSRSRASRRSCST